MKERLVSLDVFRGLTVALMILVNNPGSWAHIHPPLRHAAWHGLTPTDLVFPFFLFIVGVAVSLSFARRLEAGAERADLLQKITLRTVIIFACGIFLNGFPWTGLPGSLADLRIMGVLQRIALCYLAAGLTVVLVKGTLGRLAVMVGFAIGYELLMRLRLVSGWGAGSFVLEDNLVRWVDLQVLTAPHMSRVGDTAFESEGLLSTLPAILTTMLGFFTGEYLRMAGDLAPKLKRLAAAGCGLVAVGVAWAPIEPINKQLWTMSYVLVTGGLALAVLAFSSWVYDLRGWRRGTRPAVIFGSNPLVVFLGSGLLVRIMILIRIPQADGGSLTLQRTLYTKVFVPLAGDTWGSFLNAVVFTAFWLGVSWWLYRRRIFVKI